jgi:Cys-rich repeat protein
MAGDYVVWQGKPASDTQHHIYAYRISAGTTAQLTTGHDDTRPDTDGTTVVFTRNGSAIMAQPLSGTTPTQLSAAGAAATRDNAHVSGNNVVWDDRRNGVDNDVYWSAVSGGGDQLIAGGPGDQFDNGVDGNDVVYADGPVGGSHNIFRVTLLQCSTNANCNNGQVCVGGACVACSDSAQCGNGELCISGQCESGPGAELQQLLALAAAIHGLGTSLTDKVDITLQDVQSGDDAMACAQLDSFLHEVDAQTGKKIAPGQAAAMHASACQIKSQLGCACN